jgi:hypothetical protein
VDVLERARELQLLKLGTVSIDGTHLRASTAKDQNVTCERAQQLRTQLRLDVDQLLAQAEQADLKDQDPQQLPKEIARREKLLAKMNQACAQLEQRAKVRAAFERADYERKVAAREQREGSAQGPARARRTEQPHRRGCAPDAQRNQREGYTQSYNAQAVVDADGSQLIVGQRVSTCASDAGELEPDLKSIPEPVGQPATVLADCGYVDSETFERLQQERPDLELCVSVHREDAHAERRYDYRPLEKIKPPKTITDPELVAMAEKLKTPEGKAFYRKRACTVEPVFGIIKHVLGFRQFLLWGLRKVRGEWNLVCLAYNLKRLHALRQAVAGARKAGRPRLPEALDTPQTTRHQPNRHLTRHQQSFQCRSSTNIQVRQALNEVVLVFERAVERVAFVVADQSHRHPLQNVGFVVRRWHRHGCGINPKAAGVQSLPTPPAARLYAVASGEIAMWLNVGLSIIIEPDGAKCALRSRTSAPARIIGFAADASERKQKAGGVRRQKLCGRCSHNLQVARGSAQLRSWSHSGPRPQRLGESAALSGTSDGSTFSAAAACASPSPA